MNPKSWLPALFLSLALCATPVSGNDPQPSWQITPFAGFSLFESAQGIENSPLFGVGIGRNLDEHWAFEGQLSGLASETERTPRSDLELYQLAARLLYHFQPQQQLAPYLLIGAGGFYADADQGGSQAGAQLQYGAGLRYALNPHLALRGEVRHEIFFELPDARGKERTCNALTTLVGLQMRFADAPEAAVALPRPQATTSQVTPATVVILEEPVSATALATVSAAPSALPLVPEVQPTAQIEIPENGPASLAIAPEFAAGSAEISNISPQDRKKLKLFLEDQPSARILILAEEDENTLSFASYKLQEHRANRLRLFLIEQFGIQPTRVETMSQRNWQRKEKGDTSKFQILRFTPAESTAPVATLPDKATLLN